VQRSRSLFWPAVLILIGVIALLVNGGVVSTGRLGLLADLWPLILVVIGLEIIARRGIRGLAGEVAAVMIVVVAVAGALAYVTLAPNPGASHTLDASGPTGTLDHASLQLTLDVASITVEGSSALGPDLYRAHIEYTGTKPVVSLDQGTGKLTVSQSSSHSFVFQSRRLVLELQITTGVPWAISVDGGAADTTLGLADVRVRSIDVNTGTSREDITLGPPSGRVPITIDGGALTVSIHRPAGTEAAATASGGAVSLDGDGRQQRGIGSLSWRSAGYEGAADSYRVEVAGGACTVTVDTGGRARGETPAPQA
jgi:hypothetical protein